MWGRRAKGQPLCIWLLTRHSRSHAQPGARRTAACPYPAPSDRSEIPFAIPGVRLWAVPRASRRAAAAARLPAGHVYPRLTRDGALAPARARQRTARWIDASQGPPSAKDGQTLLDALAAGTHASGLCLDRRHCNPPASTCWCGGGEQKRSSVPRALPRLERPSVSPRASWRASCT